MLHFVVQYRRNRSEEIFIVFLFVNIWNDGEYLFNETVQLTHVNKTLKD